jgi:putative ABC transport system permease protein
MLAYQIRLAWLSLKRNPVLSLLMVAGIGLGMALAVTAVAIYFLESGDPIPHKSDKLLYVQLDAWDPDEPISSRDPSEPPPQITYQDMMGILDSEIPTHRSGMFKARLTLQPDSEGLRPYQETVRMCHGDFFRLFDVPFRFGSGWDRRADTAPEPVVVIDAETNQKLFGGENSVGRRLRIEDRDFVIAGVMAPWRPLPKFYDVLNGPNDPIEKVFLPFTWAQEWEVYSAGNTLTWKSCGDTYQDFLQSECIWIQMWVQLEDEQQKQEYMSFLNAYAAEQNKLGRFGRPKNNRLRNVTEWLASREVVSQPTRTMLVISLMFLLVCSVNLIGLLLGKFLARAAEVGVRRALGASRRWVFVQHLVECTLVGVLGGAVGTAASVFVVRLVNRLFEMEFFLRLDLKLLLAILGLALLSALIAGVYPAWRICRVQPALHLKTQ